MYLRISLNYHISIKRNYIKQSLYSLICSFTFATVALCISRVTSPVTMSSPYVLRRVVQTVSTTVVDTAQTIGPVVTLYQRYCYITNITHQIKEDYLLSFSFFFIQLRSILNAEIYFCIISKHDSILHCFYILQHFICLDVDI